MLFLDTDGTGKITQKNQYVFTEWDPTAKTDMEALLSVFDTNRNGQLDAGDADRMHDVIDQTFGRERFGARAHHVSNLEPVETRGAQDHVLVRALNDLAVLFALGDNFFIFKLFYEFVPGFSTFRIPARMGIILTFTAALLSAFSLQQLLYDEKTEQQKKTLRSIVLACVGVGTLLYAAVLSGSFAGALRYLRTL